MTKDIVLRVQEEVSPLARKAQDITIQSHEQMTEAVSFLSQLTIQLSRMTTEREKVTKPLNEALKAERGRWKPLETMLEGAILSVRKAMTVYQTEAAQKAKEAEEKIIARVGEGKGKFTIDTAVRKIGEVDHAEPSIATDVGMVKFRTQKKFEVMDITLVPMEYLLADEVAIRKAMGAGIEVAGVRYYEEQVPVNFC